MLLGSENGWVLLLEDVAHVTKIREWLSAFYLKTWPMLLGLANR